MTLNASGPISLAGSTSGQSIALELGQSATAQISLNDSAVRTLANVASGAIVMPTNFYGKSNRKTLSYTYSANTTNASLDITSISGYSAGNSDVTITVNSGVYVYSTSTATPGLTLTGGSTGDTITLVNKGFILGMGGGGGTYNTSGPTYGTAGAGGTALSLGFNTTVDNTDSSAYIAGGGGGGATGAGTGGGGAGAGTGGSITYLSETRAGGTGGGPGSAGGNGNTWEIVVGKVVYHSGGGGGRILPGSGGNGGNQTYGSGGGAGGGGAYGGTTGGAGGSGSNAGSAPSGNSSSSGGGGGGWGASGGSNSARSGGSGGKAVALNGKTITWTSGNTTRVYGAVS